MGAMDTGAPPTLVLFGVTGDLSRRKLLPALSALAARGTLPFGRIIGASRRRVAADALLSAASPLFGAFETVLLPDDARAYAALAARLAGLRGEAFFYLAVPPGAAEPIAARLALAGCAGTLVLEKPFGLDAASARLEAARIAEAFGGKVARVDHYLFKPLCSRLVAQAPGQGASRLEVIAEESLGREGRVDFYDATGALRDMGNHLLSLLCASLGARTQAERLRELSQLSVVSAERGQYEGYAEEVGHPTDTETLISLELSHRNYPQLSITLRSGKALGAKRTLVRAAGDGAAAEFGEEPSDQDAYERLFAELVRGRGESFLSEAEALESFRLLDEARARWGGLVRYARGGALAAAG